MHPGDQSGVERANVSPWTPASDRSRRRIRFRGPGTDIRAAHGPRSAAVRRRGGLLFSAPELIAQDEFVGATGEHISELIALPPRIGSWRAAMEELAAVADGSIAATEAPALEAMSDVFSVC